METMVSHKTDLVFGIVGSAFMDALDIFEPAGIRFVSVQHEQNAVHMADGYSRVTNSPGKHTVQWFQILLKTRQKISSPEYDFTNFSNRFQQICIISVSSLCMPFIFKICQPVASISVTSQFHKICYLIFGGFLVIGTSVKHCPLFPPTLSGFF